MKLGNQLYFPENDDCNIKDNGKILSTNLGFPGGSDSKESACNAGDPGSIPGSGRPLEKEMTTHSSILVWRISWTEEPGRLQSMESQRIRHNWVTNTFNTYREPIYEMYDLIKYINKYKHKIHQCSLMRSYKNPGKSDTQSRHNMNWTWKILLTYLVRAVDLGTILQ